MLEKVCDSTHDERGWALPKESKLSVSISLVEMCVRRGKCVYVVASNYGVGIVVNIPQLQYLLCRRL